MGKFLHWRESHFQAGRDQAARYHQDGAYLVHRRMRRLRVGPWLSLERRVHDSVLGTLC